MKKSFKAILICTHMSADKKNKEKDPREKVETPIPPQRVDPNKKLKEQDKGGKDRNEGK